MKRVLLGTTALVAAGVIGANAAQAAFDVQVHGNYTAAYGVVKEKDDVGEAGYKRQNQTINQDAEVHFRFMQTFDNGLTAGGRVELEGATHGAAANTASGSAGRDQIDEKWGYVKTGFGEFRFGDEDDARKLLAQYAPFATIVFSVNSPYWTFNNLGAGHAISTNSTAPFLENDSAKVIYLSPIFGGGFQFAASYVPDATQDRAQGGTGGTDEVQFSNTTSLAAAYNGQIGSVKVGASAGVTKGFSEMSIYDDPVIWEAGLVLGFGAFKIGSTLGVGNDLVPMTSTWNGANATKAKVFEIGGTYTFGANSVGLAWSRGKYRQMDRQTDTLDHIQLGFGRALGEGVTAGAFVGRFNYEDESVADNDNSGWQTGVGINMFF